VRGVDPVLPPSLQDRVDGNQPSLVEDAQLVRQLVDLDDAPGAVGHAVVIATDRDEPVMADPALELQQRIEGECRQRLELVPLGGEGVGDDPSRGAVQPDIGHRIEPVAQLIVEIVEVTEGPGQEEVLADIAERPLHLALGLGTVGPAGLGLEAVMARQGQERAVVDDVALIILAGHRRLHAVVENLDRQPAADHLRHAQRSRDPTGRDAAHASGLRAPSRCTTEPDRLK